MNRKSVVGCAIAAVMFAGSAAWPPTRRRPRRRTRRRRRNIRCAGCSSTTSADLSEAFKGLNLAPDQKAQIGAILKSHKAEIVGALQALHAKHEALLNAVRAGAVNEAAIRTAGREMGDAIGEASILRAKIRLEIRAVLTPDQCGQVDRRSTGSAGRSPTRSTAWRTHDGRRILRTGAAG